MPEWIRGKGRYSDGWIVLAEPDPNTYSPLVPRPDGDLLFELLAVNSPQRAVAFVQSWGLLHHGPGAADHRERFTEWQGEINKLNNILDAYRCIGPALAGDAKALQMLRSWLARVYT